MGVGRSVFVISRNVERGGVNYYAAHGKMGGVKDAIGYDEKTFARKFLTEEDTASFIGNELPEWGRTIHHAEEMELYEIMHRCPILFSALLGDDEEALRLALEPPGNRLLIWRC